MTEVSKDSLPASLLLGIDERNEGCGWLLQFNIQKQESQLKLLCNSSSWDAPTDQNQVLLITHVNTTIQHMQKTPNAFW